MDTDGAGLEELEAGLTKVAAAYVQRRGITYEAWRAIGVPPSGPDRGGAWGPESSAGPCGSHDHVGDRLRVRQH
jgi:hypothetical protein